MDKGKHSQVFDLKQGRYIEGIVKKTFFAKHLHFDGSILKTLSLSLH